jgi:hypothetical protein
MPKDNPFASVDKPRMTSLFGITEQGFAAIKIGSRPEIKGGLRLLGARAWRRQLCRDGEGPSGP